jgi:hypothetical protein
VDFSAQLDNLERRAAETAATVKAAAAEDRAQLKQRIQKAQVDANLAVKDAKQKPGEVADRSHSKWAQMKADLQAKMDEVKAKFEKRQEHIDAKTAAKDAEWAESEASDAIDFAQWATDNARLAVLDALDARKNADELTKVAKS